MEKTPLRTEAPPLSGLMNDDVFSLVADSIICTDEDGLIVLFNEAAEKSFGYSATELMGQHVEVLLPQRYRVAHGNHVQSFALGKGVDSRLMGHQREVSSLRKNGEEFCAEAAISRHLVNGRMILTVVHRDITKRKELDHLHEAIENELHHRIQNIFAVVSSLISLSAKSAASVDDFKKELQERLRVLASVQSFLQRGERGSVTLGDLFLAELSAYRSADGTNLMIAAAPIKLGETAAQLLALTFHELATNAAKYGAFSDLRGHVAITSECTSAAAGEQMLAIEWRETGGPPVKTPSRRGFGTTLIQQAIKRTLGADVVVDYKPAGLVCQMLLPRAAVEASA